MRISRVAVCGLLLSVGICGLAWAAAEDGAKILQARCASCHKLDVVCRNLGHDQAWWEDTDNRMVGHGAVLPQEQADALAGYLAALKPGSKPACK